MWLAAFLIITAIIIVICVSLFTKNQVDEFDGTLVNMNHELMHNFKV